MLVLNKLLYRGAVYLRALEVPEWLYHITFLRNIESIQTNGLQPGGTPSWETYDVAGRLFFTAAGGVGAWVHKLSYIARDRSDTEVEDGWVPVVLRMRTLASFSALEQDTEGSRDGSADAFYSLKPVKPENIEVFDGTVWTSVENVDEYMLRDTWKPIP